MAKTPRNDKSILEAMLLSGIDMMKGEREIKVKKRIEWLYTESVKNT